MTVFSLPDHVDFDNLVALRSEGERFLESATDPVFDLSSLTGSSSAAVAVLIAWYRHAHNLGKTLRFENVPSGIMNIIEVSDLEDVLPIERSG